MGLDRVLPQPEQPGVPVSEEGSKMEMKVAEVREQVPDGTERRDLLIPHRSVAPRRDCRFHEEAANLQHGVAVSLKPK